MMADNPFRNLPSVHDVLQAPAVVALGDSHAHDIVVEAIRQELTELRQRLSSGEMLDGEATSDMVALRVRARLGNELRPKLRLVNHATGTVRYTDAGRAPVAAER